MTSETDRALDLAVAKALGYTAAEVPPDEGWQLDPETLEEIPGTRHVTRRGGWALRTPEGHVTYWSWGPGRWNGNTDTQDEAWEQNCPYFSTSIANAFEVVAAMRARGWCYTLQDVADGQREATFTQWLTEVDAGIKARANGATEPEALCVAALQALDFEARALHAEQARTGEDGHG